MANVKFNRGILANLSSNTQDALAFLAESSTDYGYLYLGQTLVASRFLKAIDPTNTYHPTVASTGDYINRIDGWTNSNSGPWADQTGHNITGIVLTADYFQATGESSASPHVTSRSLIGVINGTGYVAKENEILSAYATQQLISENIGNNDTYHGTGTWGSSTDWKTYTAKYYRGSTEVTSSDTGYHALSFTLPIHTWTDATTYAADNANLTTPYQVAQYLSTFAGAMEYKGGLTLAEATTTTHDYKPGDVFIASAAIPAIGAEAGDMVIVKTAITTGGAFSSSNCDVFERNLDGALIKSTTNFTQYGVAYVENTTGTIASTAVGTAGQILNSTGNAAPTWVDYYYQVIAAVQDHANQFTVTPYTNGTAGSATTITINDVEHATNADKVKQTVSTTNSDKPLLIGEGSTSGSYQDVSYSAAITANASTGDVTTTGKVTAATAIVTESDTDLATTGYIDVAHSLTWHVLGAQSGD